MQMLSLSICIKCFSNSVVPTYRHVDKLMQKSLLIFFLLVLSSSSTYAEGQRIPTVAGELQSILDNRTSECSVLLNNKPILKFDCEGAFLPKVVADFRGTLGKLDEVVVLQETPMGNACNGGPLHFIGLRKDKSYRVSGPLDFCGGKYPVIKHQGEIISIIFPGGPPNRGSGHIPTEKWKYRNGQLKKVE